MNAEHIRTSRPVKETRLVTAFQWMVSAALLFPTVGGVVVLVASSVTSWSPTELLLWSPRLLELLFVFTILGGLVSGAYWPVFNGHSTAREQALFAPRRRSAMMLSVGLALYGVHSLLNVTTVTDLLQNTFVVGSAMLVCIYMYAYEVGG